MIVWGSRLERKNQERTNCERVKEQRLAFIHLLIHLPAIKALAVWIYLPQLCGSWFSFDQRSKSQHNCCHSGNTQLLLNIQRVTPFSLGTMAVTLSVSSERYLSHPTEQYPEQYSNTDCWIDRWRTYFFPWGAALALVLHCGVTWFSHIPQPWPATLEVKLSTLSLG